MHLKRDDIAQIEEDFIAAIERIESGRPLHARLLGLASKGKLRLNATNVALEAGRSRTLIAMRNCRLPKVRDRLMANADASIRHHKGNRDLNALRTEIASLRAEIVAALQWQERYFLDCKKAQREARKWKEAFRRARDATTTSSNVTPIGAPKSRA